MTQWEYARLNWVKTESGKDFALRSGDDVEIVRAADVIDALNKVGANAWEAVSLNYYGKSGELETSEGDALLKRPVKPQEAATSAPRTGRATSA